MDPDSSHFLLLGDLRASTQLKRQTADEVARLLRRELAYWSRECAGDLIAGLDFNYGDEFAGVFSNPERVYDIVDGLRSALRGRAEFRFVLARGRIGAASPLTRQMGGPVFVTANNALKRLKIEDRFAGMATGHALADATLTALIEAANALRVDMTDYQYSVFERLRSGQSQKDIARDLGKFEQSVSDAAKRGRADLTCALDHAIGLQLRELAVKSIDHGYSIDNH